MFQIQSGSNGQPYPTQLADCQGGSLVKKKSPGLGDSQHLVLQSRTQHNFRFWNLKAQEVK